MMMIKVRGESCKWEILDGFDRLSEREINPYDCPKDLYLDFTPEQESWRNQETNHKTVIWLYRGSQVINRIISYSPIYILNNEGKTVERI